MHQAASVATRRAPKVARDARTPFRSLLRWNSAAAPFAFLNYSRAGSWGPGSSGSLVVFLSLYGQVLPQHFSP
jgi:hypothetical protein